MFDYSMKIDFSHFYDMKLSVSKIIILLATFYAVCAHANYPSAKDNFSVRSEVENDSDRMIPKTDHFVFAADGQGYHRFSAVLTFTMAQGIGFNLDLSSLHTNILQLT